MEEVVLEAQMRQEKGKSRVKSLRRGGFIPACVYAANKESQSIKLNHHDFLHLIHQYHLESTVINLKINPVRNNISNGVKGQKPRIAHVLVKEVQHDPVMEDIIHVDFQEISLTSKIKVNVRIVPKGEPVGVKQEGGTLNHLIWELEVECLPTQIPEEIPVDVAQLKIGDSVHVRDLSLPGGVRVINDPDSLVFSLEPPIKEEEIVAAVPAEGEAPAEPEVIKKKKEEVLEEGEEKEKKEVKKEAKKEEKREEKKEG